MTETTLAAALLLGFAGAGHCFGMCGGIAAALNLGGKAGPATTIAYHGGRILSYTALGATVGGLAGSVTLDGWLIGLRYLAGILLVLMGLYVADWWRGMLWLERGGAVLWQPVQRFSRRWLPIRRPPEALLLGLCWGLMPCGLIYSSLAWAATAADAGRSALLMLCFGLGTLPSMVATSFGAAGVQAALRRRGLKLAIGALLIVAGAWTLFQVISHSSHLQHAAGGAASDTPHQHHQHR
ncbi:MAG: sulfite exporter TauE/SafE family protein [Pseudomonadota bacterium]